MDELIYELIKLVKTLSPELWRIGLGQVRAKIISHIATDIIVIVLVVIVFVIFLQYATKQTEEIDATVTKIIAWSIIIVFGGGALLDILAVVLPMIVNPEFYAIKIIMSLVK